MSKPEDKPDEEFFSDDPFAEVGEAGESVGELTTEDIDALLNGKAGVIQRNESELSEDTEKLTNEEDFDDPLAELWEYMEKNGGEIPEEIIDALLSGKPVDDQIDLERFSNRMGLSLEEIIALSEQSNDEN